MLLDLILFMWLVNIEGSLLAGLVWTLWLIWRPASPVKAGQNRGQNPKLID